MTYPFYFDLTLSVMRGGDGTRKNLPTFQRDMVQVFGAGGNPKSEALQRFDKAAASARAHLAAQLDAEVEFDNWRTQQTTTDAPSPTTDTEVTA